MIIPSNQPIVKEEKLCGMWIYEEECVIRKRSKRRLRVGAAELFISLELPHRARGVRGLATLCASNDLRDNPLPLSNTPNEAPEATALLFWQVSMA